MNKLLKVVVLNDTRSEHHHGCSRVMNAIDFYLKGKASDIVSLSVGEDWQKREDIKRAIISADKVIVNGEGTIHHNSALGFSLVKVAKFAHEYGVEAFLINMTYQANSLAYKKYLSFFNKIFVRESFSQKELAEVGVDSEIVPDLTFSFSPSIQEREFPVLVTCSVKQEITQAILDAYAHENHITFSSIFNNNLCQVSPFNFWKRLKGIYQNNTLTELGAKVSNKFSFDKKANIPWKYQYTHVDYADFLAKAELVICGRFHAMTMCINQQTPFVALESNSHKVSGVLTDIGLDKNKFMLNPAQLNSFDPSSFSFSAQEKEMIRTYCQQAKEKIAAMFAEVLN